MARKNKPRKNIRKPRGKGKAKRRPFRFLFKWMIVLGLWATIALAGVFAYYAAELPAITEDASFERKRAIIVKDSKGDTIARYGELMGNKVTIKDIPQNLINAVLATEDRRFYSHFGVDPLGLARAVFVNMREGRRAQGGSTLTQQLAKNLFLSQERTYKRKIQEAMLAVWLEHQLTKDEILTAYLNRVYLGSGTYGVDAAAQLYFKSSVKGLSLRESATLAGLLKAPSRYSPISNPGLSKQRTEIVLKAMVDAGYITESELNTQVASPPKPTAKPSDAMADRYFADWVVDSLEDLIGTPAEDLVVETTLNSRIQGKAQDALTAKVQQNGAAKNYTQGAFIILRPDGAVVSMIGGTNYSDSQFNRATQAKRPPGSAFKPIVYLASLEKGNNPRTLIYDEKIESGGYRPQNFGDQYYGEVTLDESLAKSMNSVSYRLMKDVGIGAVINTAKKLGIESDLESDLSLSLGSSGITLLEMAGAYATFSNTGLAAQPYAITKITAQKSGEVYYERPKNRELKRIFDKDQVQDLTSMMHSVIERGTGQKAKIGIAAAGKTGTSQDGRDALFMGYTRELVGVVWLGNDDNSPTKLTGGSDPAQIWATVMGASMGAYKAYAQDDFAPSRDYMDFIPQSDAFDNLLGNLFGGFGNREREVREPTRAQQPQKQYRFMPREDPQPREGQKRSISPSRQYND